MWTSKADEFDVIQLHSEMYDFSIAGFPLLWGGGILEAYEQLQQGKFI